MVYPIHIWDEKFKDYGFNVYNMSLSNNLTYLCVIRQNVGLKNTFPDICYNILAVKKILIKGKKYV